jgi:hypothetical protein
MNAAPSNRSTGRADRLRTAAAAAFVVALSIVMVVLSIMIVRAIPAARADLARLATAARSSPPSAQATRQDDVLYRSALPFAVNDLRSLVPNASCSVAGEYVRNGLRNCISFDRWRVLKSKGYRVFEIHEGHPVRRFALDADLNPKAALVDARDFVVALHAAAWH